LRSYRRRVARAFARCVQALYLIVCHDGPRGAGGRGNRLTAKRLALSR
jgi:hypothetical protein